MFKLPTNTFLGELSINHTFYFFDIPRLFTCKNKTGSQYLVLSIYDDNEQSEWLYLPISNDRLSALVARDITLRDAFTHAEDNHLYKIVLYEEGEPELTILMSRDIKSEDLPEENTYLKTNEEVKVDLGVIEPRQAAISSLRETLNIHLYPHDTSLPELSIRGFGAILTTLQDLMDALGQAIKGEPTLKGAISSDILKQTQFRATQIFNGSFGVQLKSKENCDLFSDSLMSNVLEEFITLLRESESEEATTTKLHHLEGRVASKYRLFLKELTKLETPLKTEWGSPKENKGDLLFLNKETIAKAYSLVSKIDIEMSETVKFTAELLGLDVEIKSFRVRNKIENIDYIGKIAKESKDKVLHSEINAIYNVTLKKIIETNSSSGKETIKWLLLDLQLIE